MIHLGLDIGSVSAKLAGVGDAEDLELIRKLESIGDTFFPVKEPSATGAGAVFVADYRRIKGDPARTAAELLEELLVVIPREQIGGIRLTGSGGGSVGKQLDAPYENDFRAIAKAIGVLHPEVRTVFEMGGDTSKYLLVEPGEDGAGIADYEKNGDCAAGTGSFMDQQASRLLYNIEEVGDIVMTAGAPATIAGRCSVFAKSDMIHAQQKGFTPAQILRGLCEAVVRNFKGSIVKGKPVVPVVAFIGGVAANKGVVQAMRDLFKLAEQDLIVPPAYAWMGAIGAAMISAEVDLPESSRAPWLTGLDINLGGSAEDLPRTDPLVMDQVILLRDRAKPYSFEGRKLPIDVYLGIDIGSVSTNLAVVDDHGDLVHEIYIRTESRPIEVVNKGLREIEELIGPKIVIRGVGTTGSGRELVGELIGADTVNDEITAHKTGAEYVAHHVLGSRVDTIFEIGGQDSKFISIEDGVVVDFAMNEACAAGTGSFLEEQAERLGIKIKGEFAAMALSSTQPIRLGERCTVFMEKELVPYLQKGATKEDLVAGLAYSIALNYLNRVVRGRRIGEIVYFQGGTAYNDSVAAAFATVLNKPIIVPPHNGVIGAIGMALLACEKITRTGRATTFRGYRLEAVEYTIRSFTCKACSNYCDMQEFTVEGNKTFWGDKCSDQFRKRAKVEKLPIIPDLVGLREKLLMGNFHENRNGRPTVGIARSMYFYDRFPFYRAFFQEIGWDVILSGPTSKQVAAAGVDAAVSEPCFPVKVAHGHQAELIQKGVDWIFVPNLINSETPFTQVGSHLCPWGQTLPFVLASAGTFADDRDKMLAPSLHFREGKESIARELYEFFGKRFGFSRKRIDDATEKAHVAQQQFWTALRQAGREALEALEAAQEPGVVLVGRAYNMNDRGVNLSVPSKLRDYYGVNVIPMDFLALDDIDISDVNDAMFWNYGRKILQAAKVVRQKPNLHIVYITNFKCGPDSYIKHFVRDASGKPYLTLQFDGHANDAGVMTRCEAYLDSKGFLRRWNQSIAV